MGSVAGIIGLGVTLVGASAVFAQLQGALNRVWGLQPKPGKATHAILTGYAPACMPWGCCSRWPSSWSSRFRPAR